MKFCSPVTEPLHEEMRTDRQAKANWAHSFNFVANTPLKEGLIMRNIPARESAYRPKTDILYEANLGFSFIRNPCDHSTKAGWFVCLARHNK
jgi:hypothetical protein